MHYCNDYKAKKSNADTVCSGEVNRRILHLLCVCQPIIVWKHVSVHTERESVGESVGAYVGEDVGEDVGGCVGEDVGEDDGA